MSALYFYDDARARQFEPFALTRPASELRSGAMILRQRWEHVTGLESKGFVGAKHLRDFDEDGAPPFIGTGEIPAGSVIVNSRFVISLGVDLSKPFDLLMNDGVGCAVRLARPLPVKDLAEGTVDLGSLQTSLGGKKVAGRWMADIWDYIGTLADQLNEDIPLLGRDLPSAHARPGATMGDGEIFIEEGAEIGSLCRVRHHRRPDSHSARRINSSIHAPRRPARDRLRLPDYG